MIICERLHIVLSIYDINTFLRDVEGAVPYVSHRRYFSRVYKFGQHKRLQAIRLQPTRLRFQKRSRYNSRLTPESIAISKQQNLFISKIRLDDFTQISNFDFVDNITLPRLRLFIQPRAIKIINISTANITLCVFIPYRRICRHFPFESRSPDKMGDPTPEGKAINAIYCDPKKENQSSSSSSGRSTL